MVFLLLFSFFGNGSFEWVEVKGYDAKSITKQVKESSVVINYGKVILKKSLTHFDSDIFEAGGKLVISEDAEILRVPAGIEVKKTEDVEIVKHDRYSVEYEEGALKDEWVGLKRESAQKIGVSSIDNVTIKQIPKFSAKMTSENVDRRKSRKTNTVTSKYPAKIYFSFILIEVNGERKLLPVVLTISPISELLQDMELN